MNDRRTLKYDNCKDCLSDCEHAGKDREFVCVNGESCKRTKPERHDKQLAKMNELSFLFEWVRETDFCGDLDIDILRILWTAYCFHNGLDVDTAEYDNVLLCIYNSIVPNDSVNVLMTYDEFDAYMAHYLV